jgi:hypothetical protein
LGAVEYDQLDRSAGDTGRAGLRELLTDPAVTLDDVEVVAVLARG